MGISIVCNKSKNSIDIPLGSFLRLRQLVARLASKEFGDLYDTLPNALRIYDDKQRNDFYKNFDREAELLIKKRKVTIGIVDFCMQSDCDGHVGMRICRQVLQALEASTDEKDTIIGYAGWDNPARLSDFKNILKDGVETKAGIDWH